MTVGRREKNATKRLKTGKSKRNVLCPKTKKLKAEIANEILS
jgi:hypothetical protein